MVGADSANAESGSPAREQRRMTRLVRSTLLTSIAIVALAVIFSGGCSRSSEVSSTGALSPDTRSDADALRERASRWWECRVKADYKSQYDLWDPGFKSRVDLDRFVGGQGSNVYLKYDVKDVTVTGDSAFVTVEYVSKIGLRVPNLEPEPQTTLTDQEWVRVDGAWYFKCPENPFQAARDAAGGRRKPVVAQDENSRDK
jgi:hypothetical protein